MRNIMRLIEWEVAEDGYEEQIIIPKEKRELAAPLRTVRYFLIFFSSSLRSSRDFMLKKDKALYPIAVASLCANRIMSSPHNIAHIIKNLP